MLSGSVLGGVCEWPLMKFSPDLLNENMSSEREMLSRRNAAVARRLAVWRRTMASSIKPRWQHA